MKIATPGQVEAWRPRAGVAYRLRVPTSAEALRWDLETERLGGPYHDLSDIAVLTRVGLEECGLDDARRDALAAEVDAYLDALHARSLALQAAGQDGEALAQAFHEHSAALRKAEAAWLRVRTLVAGGYEPLRQALAENRAWEGWRGLAACRLFLMEVEGLDLPLGRGPDGALDQTTLDRLPATHLAGVARFCQGLVAPTEDEEKNFEPLSPSSPGATASDTSSDTAPAAS